MGNKAGSRKKKEHLKVLILGIAGSGKSTFTKQMKIIHDGFSESELRLYKDVLIQNLIVGMKELAKQAEKLDYQVKTDNRKHARYFLEFDLIEMKWDPKISRKAKKLWEDAAIQHTWKAAPGYQLQMTHMDYLMSRLEIIVSPDFVPNNEDMLHARQRTTGAQRTTFIKDKICWELIDVGGQRPERAKWESVIKEGSHAIIFFCGLDEYNMLSSEDKDKKTKMEVSMEVFSDVLNAPNVKGTCILLFLNKIDLFEKKIHNPKAFKEFQKTFTDYKGTAKVEDCCKYIQGKYTDLLTDGDADIHCHITCALDTEAMTTVFQAVKENIFLKRIEANRVNF